MYGMQAGPVRTVTYACGALLLCAACVGVWRYTHKQHILKPDSTLGSVVVLPAAKQAPDSFDVPTFETIKDARLEVVFLTGLRGMTLYTFAKDTIDTSTCYGVCSTIWLPYTLSSPIHIVLPPVVKGVVDTTKRDNGALQLTYKGMPLYYYTGDKKKGDTLGHKVGGMWFVAKL